MLTIFQSKPPLGEITGQESMIGGKKIRNRHSIVAYGVVANSVTDETPRSLITTGGIGTDVANR